MLSPSDSRSQLLAIAKNASSRCALHLAVLHQSPEIVRHLADNFPATLAVGDNVSHCKRPVPRLERSWHFCFKICKTHPTNDQSNIPYELDDLKIKWATVSSLYSLITFMHFSVIYCSWSELPFTMQWR